MSTHLAPPTTCPNPTRAVLEIAPAVVLVIALVAAVNLVAAVGSVIAASASSVAVLMAGRGLSGVGAAMVLPAMLAVTLARLEVPDRPKAIALWSGITGMGGAVGNLGGGAAVELGGWRWVFWAGVPIALAAAALIAVRVPHQAPHRDPVDAGAVPRLVRALYVNARYLHDVTGYSALLAVVDVGIGAGHASAVRNDGARAAA